MDEKTIETLAQIIEKRETSLMMLSCTQRPEKGQLVMTGLQVGPANLMRRVGYCVQIRLKCGQFGSDMIFLRHADGSLCTHENQYFFALSPEQEALAMPLFAEHLAEEDYAGYSCCNGVREVGFIIEKSKSESSVGSSSMTMTTTDEDGVTTTSHMVFLS